MTTKYKLKFQFKSNENPWNGEFTAREEMTREEAVDWWKRFAEFMPDYIITLYYGDIMLDENANRSIFDDVDE